MVFRWLVNFGLLALPIAATLGVLLGLQSHRRATGQPLLFVDNGIKKERYCQKSFGIHPETLGQEYTLNPNQWGWTEGEAGSLCMNVTSFNNRTYATNTTAPVFSVSWQYPPGPETAPVHAFPNIKIDGNVFPTRLDSVRQVNIETKWSIGMGNATSESTNVDDLTQNLVNTNVAIDMFLDSDREKAMDSTKATYEVMVWFAAVGPATQAIGQNDGVLATKSLNGTNFSLYFGQNAMRQYVLTWMASQLTTEFNGDIAPLIDEILSTRRANFPSSSDYLGYLSFGTEALSSRDTVTFYSSNFMRDPDGWIALPTSNGNQELFVYEIGGLNVTKSWPPYRM